MSEKNSRSFPIRVSEELYAELEEVRKLTGYSQQDLARLALRIGLVDLRAAKDIAKVIQEAATDKGASFLAYAKGKIESSFTPQTAEDLEESPQPWTTRKTVPTARIAGSTKPFQACESPETATIVPLPPQHVVGLNEQQPSPAIPEKRNAAATYRKVRQSR